MNVYDCAMQMETEGITLYKEFADASSDEGISSIFNELADQEKKHYETFRKMKEGDTSVNDTPVSLENVKAVFASWKKNKGAFDFKISQADLYRKALDIEKKSVAFYEQHAAETGGEKEKEVLLKIAKEERKHYDIVENIIEFITKPDRWVEHAQFSKIGEEY